MKLVTPETYWTGKTEVNMAEVTRYLEETGQEEFLKEIEAAKAEGLADGEILCSMYAKMCYASLVVGKNENITRTRSIYDNILGTIKSGHGSVFEHCTLNFVVRNCSRVFTHELVRHRAGTAFSQTSGRYVRTDEIYFVHDPILDDCKDLIEEGLEYLEKLHAAIEARKGLDKIKDFDTKKKITSALRRILPNGQSNEIGFSINLRALRHVIELRTGRHAEWEIRLIFNQVFDLVNAVYPAMFADAQVVEIDGLKEITFAHSKI